MSAWLRTTLSATCSIALCACGEAFISASTSSGSGGSSASSVTSGGAGGTFAGSGGAGSSSTSGGSGGATCDGTDHDGDGASLCDGDCDDENPFIYPGALEICGDGVDEDCDGSDNTGEECDGFSAYVSQLKGSVGAKGTKDDPVATIAEGIAHAAQLGGQVAVLVAEGSYAEDLTLTGKMSLVGGYDPADWSVRDPQKHTTSIKDSAISGLKLVGLGDEMLVDGFAITGRSVQAGNESSVAVTIDGGGPVLSNCSIMAGNVSGSGASIGVKVVVQGALGGEPKLWANAITGGTSSSGPSYGAVIDADTMAVSIAGGAITAGKGSDSVALLVRKSASVSAWKTSFQSGLAKGAATPSSSLGLWMQGGELLFDSNLVNADQVQDPPSCFTPDVWCGGLRISSGHATITNNVILGSASDRSAGLHLLEDNDALTDIVVSSNTILGAGRADMSTVSAAVLLGSPKLDMVVTQIGRFRNNIFFGGTAASNYGVYEQWTPSESCDPEALDHNLFYFPVNDPNPGVFYSDWNGVTAQAITKLEEVPGDKANLTGDPKLSQGHLDPTSPCRNAGTADDAPDHDIDQESRPQEGKFDIGPDELFVSK